MAHRRTLELTPEQQRDLQEHRDHDPRPYVRERCAALLKVSEGKAAFEIAHNGLLKARDPDTLYNWLDIYQDTGLSGLIAREHGGSRRRCL